MSMTVTNPQSFIDAINQGVQSHIARIIREEAAVASEKVRRRVEGEADHLALSLLQKYDVQQIGPNLVITVRKGE